MAAVLRGDAHCFDGHGRRTPLSTNTAVDGADMVACQVAALTGEVTISATLPTFLSSSAVNRLITSAGAASTSFTASASTIMVAVCATAEDVVASGAVAMTVGAR